MERKELASRIERIYEVMRTDGLTLVDYVEQLSWLLFLRVYERLEGDRKIEADFEGTAFAYTIEPKFSWSSWAEKDLRADHLKHFIETELLSYLSSLSGSHERDLVASVFSDIRQKMRDPNNLKQVINMINEFDFSNPEDSHLLSQVYEETLMMMGREGGAAGEYYTPRPVVRLMVKILQPRVGQTIYDPMCGSCGFLVESFNLMKAQRKLSVFEWEKLQNFTYFGKELKAVPFLIGVMNCLLHGLSHPNIRRGDTFEENVVVGLGERFDTIMTNPPFGGKISKHLMANVPISTSSTQLGALQHCLRRLSRNGRCGIVVPEGILSGEGAFKKVRKQMLQEFSIHTIISLPQGVFANVSPKGGQGPKTNLLFFEKPGPTREIWYYELNPTGGRKFTKANPTKDEDLSDCFVKWTERAVSENSWIVTGEEAIRRDYDLSPTNPNRRSVAPYQDPERLLAGAIERQRKALILLEEARRAMSGKDGIDA
jgi:type I restriction enzyme M protein